MKPSLSAIILAAGTSSRMGSQNKLLLNFRGQPIVQHVLTAVQKSQATEIIVVLGHQAETVQSVMGAGNFNPVYNADFAKGMTSSIQTGIRAADSAAEGWLIILGDLVFLRSEDIDQVITAFVSSEKPKPIIVPCFQDRNAHPVLFHAAYRDEILRHKEPQGCRGVIHAHRDQWIRLSVDDRLLYDIDTPEDYRRLSA